MAYTRAPLINHNPALLGTQQPYALYPMNPPDMNQDSLNAIIPPPVPDTEPRHPFLKALESMTGYIPPATQQAPERVGGLNAGKAAFMGSRNVGNFLERNLRENMQNQQIAAQERAQFQAAQQRESDRKEQIAFQREKFNNDKTERDLARKWEEEKFKMQQDADAKDPYKLKQLEKLGYDTERSKIESQLPATQRGADASGNEGYFVTSGGQTTFNPFANQPRQWHAPSSNQSLSQWELNFLANGGDPSVLQNQVPQGSAEAIKESGWQPLTKDTTLPEIRSRISDMEKGSLIFDDKGNPIKLDKPETPVAPEKWLEGNISFTHPLGIDAKTAENWNKDLDKEHQKALADYQKNLDDYTQYEAQKKTYEDLKKTRDTRYAQPTSGQQPTEPGILPENQSTIDQSTTQALADKAQEFFSQGATPQEANAMAKQWGIKEFNIPADTILAFEPQAPAPVAAPQAAAQNGTKAKLLEALKTPDLTNEERAQIEARLAGL